MVGCGGIECRCHATRYGHADSAGAGSCTHIPASEGRATRRGSCEGHVGSVCIARAARTAAVDTGGTAGHRAAARSSLNDGKGVVGCGGINARSVNVSKAAGERVGNRYRAERDAIDCGCNGEHSWRPEGKINT